MRHESRLETDWPYPPQEEVMKSNRFAFAALILFALVAATGPALFADDGIEVLSNETCQDGIEVLGIEVLGIEVLGIEVLGIEVLGIEVLDTGTTYTIRVQDAPAGTLIQAEMSPNGEETILVDVTPIDPATGVATFTFPASIPGNRITFNISEGGYVEGMDFD
jgi:hypothetical protein